MAFVRLESVAHINPRCPRDLDETQAVSFLAMASVSEEGQVLGEETRTLADTKKGYTYFERGDVLLAKITPCFENGKAAYLGKLKHRIGFGSTEFHVIRPIDGKLDPKYLFYLVWCDQFRFYGQKSMTGAAGQKRVSSDFLKSFKIPLPPLPEQRRIAAILDKADAIRRKRQQAIRLTEEFLRSVFLDMFGDPVLNPKGWETAKLTDLCMRVTDGTHQSPRWEITGIPFLFVSNIVKGKISFNTRKFISEDSWHELTKRCPIEVGDLLYTTVGSYGNAAMVLEERKFCFQRHIAHIKPDGDKINPKFLLGQMQSSAVKRQADKQARGVAQKTLNLKELKEFVILVPPREEQLKYIAIQDGVEKNLGRQAEALSREENLFNSLVQRAFRGEL